MNTKKKLKFDDLSSDDEPTSHDGGGGSSSKSGSDAHAAAASTSVNARQAKSLVDFLAIPVGYRQHDHIQSIKACLKNVKFFQQYELQSSFDDMLQNLDLERRAVDSILFREKDVADKFFIILSGRVGLYISNTPSQAELPSDSHNQQSLGVKKAAIPTSPTRSLLSTVGAVGVKEIAQLEEGESFGEVGLLYNTERTATAICLEPTSLLVLQKYVFEKYLSTSQAANTKVAAMIDFYSSIWMFHSLNPTEIRGLAMKTVLNQCAKNTVLIKQGEKPKGVYFVSKGIVKIVASLKLKVDSKQQLVLDANNQPILVEGSNKQAAATASVACKAIDVQIDEIGNGSMFADYEVLNNLTIDFTAVAGTFCEILTINLTDLRACVSDEVFTTFTKQVKHYPSHEQVKKQYVENIAWSAYKNDVIHAFNNEMINSLRSQKINEHRMPFLPKVQMDKYSYHHERHIQSQHELPEQPLPGEASGKHSNGNNNQNAELQRKRQSQSVRWKSTHNLVKEVESKSSGSTAMTLMITRAVSSSKIPKKDVTANESIQLELNALLSRGTESTNTAAIAQNLSRPKSLLVLNRSNHNDNASGAISSKGSNNAIGQNESKQMKIQKRTDVLVSTLKLPMITKSQHSNTNKQILPIIKPSSKTVRLLMEIY